MTGCWRWHTIWIKVFFWLILKSVASHTVEAFVPIQNQCHLLTYYRLLSMLHPGKQVQTIRFLLDSDNPYSPTTENIHNMEEVIVSLCFDSDDASRRRKLAQLLQDNLQNQDGGDAFIKLFDQVLIVIGDRMRLEANDAAIEMTQNEIVDASDDTKIPSFPLPSQQKSLTERRLWACVDMMVQSKILVKQAKVKRGDDKGFSQE